MPTRRLSRRSFVGGRPLALPAAQPLLRRLTWDHTPADTPIVHRAAPVVAGTPLVSVKGWITSSELRMVNETLKAQASAQLLMFTFAKSTTIDDALRTKLLAGGFTVRGVLDSSQSAHAFSPHPELIAAGARLRRDTLPNQGKLHHKLLVLDDQVTIGGSFNYTGPANQFNDENLFVITNPQVAQRMRAEVTPPCDSLVQSRRLKASGHVLIQHTNGGCGEAVRRPGRSLMDSPAAISSSGSLPRRSRPSSAS